MAVGVVAILWAIWRTRNDVCFNKVFPVDPRVIIGKVAYWICFWFSFQNKNCRDLQVAGA